MLDQDLSLGYHSISMVDGHAGTDITFQAATREIVMSSWCMREKKRLLPFGKKKYSETRNETRYPVPPDIHTEKELREYVRSNWPMYFC